jgi:hypothetical protein
MGDPPLTTFLRSNYVMWVIKTTTKRVYKDFDDIKLETMAAEALESARCMEDERLTEYLNERKGLTEVIRRLPYDRFSWITYTIDELVPTLWVTDLPHSVTHGSMRDVLNFARDGLNQKTAPIFFERVSRLRKLQTIYSLPILVVAPSRSQRSNRRYHSPKAERPQAPPFCKVDYLVEGKAYIEDGHHRGIARLLESTQDHLLAIRFDAAS